MELPLFGDDDRKIHLFIDVAQDYLNGLDVEYSSSLSYENILNKHWLPEFGNWLMPDIRPKHIKAKLAKLDICQKTKKNILIPLRGVFDYGIDNELCDVNPVTAVKLKRHQKPKVERFYPNERDSILSALSGKALVYFSLFFATGMRPNELLGLQWKDWYGQRFHVRRGIVRRKIKLSTKTHEARYVYVPDWAKDILLTLDTQDTNEWVFVNSIGTPHLDSDYFNVRWVEALKTAKVPYRIPYTCRHTRAAELLSVGEEPGRAAAQLGHSLEMFFRIYSEWIEEYSRGEDTGKLNGNRPNLKGESLTGKKSNGPKMGQTAKKKLQAIDFKVKIMADRTGLEFLGGCFGVNGCEDNG